MARNANDREDLLAEATALVDRASLTIDGVDEPLLAGFRRNGCASFYFGSQLAFHFNSSGQLRRAYHDDLLYKAEAGRLISLRRIREGQSVSLLRHALALEDEQTFLHMAERNLQALRSAIHRSECIVVGEATESGKVIERIRSWLDLFAEQIRIAPRANAD